MLLNAEFVSETHSDFGHFREALSGRTNDLTQLSPGPLQLTRHQVEFEGRLALSHLASNRHLTDKVVIDQNWITFVICFSHQVFCGLEAPKGSLIIFGSSREYRRFLPEGFETFEISAPVDEFRSAGLNLGDGSLDDLRPDRCVLKLSNDKLDAFRQLSTGVNELIKSKLYPTVDPAWAAATRERAIGLIESTLRRSRRAKFPTMTSLSSKWLLTSRALDSIDLLGPSTATIAELSQTLGCNKRTLQVAFKTILGISPLQYLLARRLELARRDLLAAQPGDETVPKIAASHEFFHFGRFSQYYSTLFGELPCQTLKRKCRERLLTELTQVS